MTRRTKAGSRAASLSTMSDIQLSLKATKKTKTIFILTYTNQEFTTKHKQYPDRVDIGRPKIKELDEKQSLAHPIDIEARLLLANNRISDRLYNNSSLLFSLKYSIRTQRSVCLMTTIWPLPRIDIQDLSQIDEQRPTALLTNERSWSRVSSLINLPLVIQAEPPNADLNLLRQLSEGLPEQVEVIYAVGGGLVADIGKYIGQMRDIPVVIIPTALSVDGFFTPLAAVREAGSVHYVDTKPAERLIIDWDVIKDAPRRLRGAAIVELLTIVTGLLDWRYAADRNKNTASTRYLPWAASLMAGIAQQAFKIAEGVGEGRIESLSTLLDLICTEVRLTNQLGHTRPQEGSEQYFAYAIEPKVSRGRGVPYADLVGPGILIAAALHGQDVNPIRETLLSAGTRLSELEPDDIIDTLHELPDYVVKHNLPYSILNELEITTERARELLSITKLDR
ncbi:MAG: iron-containing alcohol dehydrogenase [Chloroflexi bacterium]|nr:MAG: iron-containing alcohol dehydrogenase [Chloroflexota bacterium]